MKDFNVSQGALLHGNSFYYKHMDLVKYVTCICICLERSFFKEILQ